MAEQGSCKARPGVRFPSPAPHRGTGAGFSGTHAGPGPTSHTSNSPATRGDEPVPPRRRTVSDGAGGPDGAPAGPPPEGPAAGGLPRSGDAATMGVRGDLDRAPDRGPDRARDPAAPADGGPERGAGGIPAAGRGVTASEDGDRGCHADPEDTGDRARDAGTGARSNSDGARTDHEVGSSVFDQLGVFRGNRAEGAGDRGCPDPEHDPMTAR